MSFSSAAAAPKRLEQPELGSVSAPHVPAWQTIVYCLLLGATTFAAYHPLFHNGFLNYDDDRYITDNLHVRAGLTWATVKWAFTTFDEANWTPLSWLSHALDCQLFGVHPAAHHAVSLAIHVGNAILLFLLLQAATGLRWRSLIVAALVALHPINVESVAWAAERKNVLSTFFFLLAFHAYVWYTRKPGIQRYAPVFFLFACGLLSKSQIITFPCLLLLWDYWPLGRISGSGQANQDAAAVPVLSRRWLLAEKLPLFALSAASAFMTMQAEKAGGAVQTFTRYSLPLRIETAVISYVRYLAHAFWPTNLVALYPHPTKLYPAWQVAAAALLLVAITSMVVMARRQPYLAVGWFWFLGSMVPMIGLVQVGPQAMADRFAYIPLIGIFVAVTWWIGDTAASRKVESRWLAVAAIACLIPLAILTSGQVTYWRDVPTFWQRTLALTEGNYIAENNLGDYLFQAGKPDEAAAHFRNALAIQPTNLLANMNLAAYEDSRGHTSAAIERYQAVAASTRDVDIRAAAFTSLAFDYRDLGETKLAQQYFETAVQLAPHRTRAMVGLGLLAEDRGDNAEAARQYSQAVSIHPNDVSFWLLARALRKQGRGADAAVATSHVANPAAAENIAVTFVAKHSR
jgi:tetratricopeptide (TPR) repeat protein